jgi:hypothetical protein
MRRASEEADRTEVAAAAAAAAAAARSKRLNLVAAPG